MADDIIKALTGVDNSEIDGASPPSDKLVDWFHSRVSLGHQEDVHAQVGFGRFDRPRGDHRHQDGDSAPLWQAGEFDFTALAAGASNSQIIDKVNVILAALRKKQY